MVSSQAGQIGIFGYTATLRQSSPFAVLQSLRMELRPHNIHAQSTTLLIRQHQCLPAGFSAQGDVSHRRTARCSSQKKWQTI